MTTKLPLQSDAGSLVTMNPLQHENQDINDSVVSIRSERETELLALLQDVRACSSNSKKIDLLRQAAYIVLNFTYEETKNCILILQFRDALECILDLTIIPSFESREYFSYETDDFHNYPEISESVLLFFRNIFVCLCKSDLRQEFESLSLEFKETAETHISSTSNIAEVKRNVNVDKCVKSFLPKLFLLITAHLEKQLWSSTECQKLSSDLFSKTAYFFSCDSPPAVFTHIKVSSVETQKQATLLSWILCYCTKPLSKDQWQKNPFLSSVFHSVISNVESPNLSNHIEQVMATSLNFLDDHQADNKIKGISCLFHLMKNASAEELRWYNRADVIFEALKKQMYSKDEAVVKELFPCLFNILKVLKGTPHPCRNKDAEVFQDLYCHHHAVMETLLQIAEMENMISLRRLYITFLRDLVKQLEIFCVRHLIAIVRVISMYMEVIDYDGDRGRIGALLLLETVLKIAWPVIKVHAETILKLLLKFLIDINSDSYEHATSESVRSETSHLTTRCLQLLSQACPDVLPCLQRVRQLEELCHIAALDSIIQ